MRRLDNYQHRHTDLFSRVIDEVEANFLPQIRRHVLTGRAALQTQNLLFDQADAVDMVIDVMSERGYQVSYDLERTVVPERLTSDWPNPLPRTPRSPL